MTPSCPVCGKPVPSPRTAPFCSIRCADVDLGRWFGGGYAIPGPPADPDEAPASRVESPEQLG